MAWDVWGNRHDVAGAKGVTQDALAVEIESVTATGSFDDIAGLGILMEHRMMGRDGRG